MQLGNLVGNCILGLSGNRCTVERLVETADLFEKGFRSRDQFKETQRQAPVTLGLGIQRRIIIGNGNLLHNIFHIIHHNILRGCY